MRWQQTLNLTWYLSEGRLYVSWLYTYEIIPVYRVSILANLWGLEEVQWRILYILNSCSRIYWFWFSPGSNKLLFHSEKRKLIKKQDKFHVKCVLLINITYIHILFIKSTTTDMSILMKKKFQGIKRVWWVLENFTFVSLLWKVFMLFLYYFTVL